MGNNEAKEEEDKDENEMDSSLIANLMAISENKK